MRERERERGHRKWLELSEKRIQEQCINKEPTNKFLHFMLPQNWNSLNVASGREQSVYNLLREILEREQEKERSQFYFHTSHSAFLMQTHTHTHNHMDTYSKAITSTKMFVGTFGCSHFHAFRLTISVSVYTGAQNCKSHTYIWISNSLVLVADRARM